MVADTSNMNQDPVPSAGGQRQARGLATLGGVVPWVFRDVQLQEAGGGFRVSSLTDRAGGRVSDTGALVLASCDGSRTLAELIGDFERAYPEAAAQIATDIFDAVRKLYRSRLITFCGARTAGDPVHLPATFHLNRGDVVSSLLEQRGWRRAASGEIAELSLWHPRRGPRFGRLQCFEPHVTRALRCKRQLALNLQAAGCEWIGPDSCADLDSFTERDDGDALWFVKLSGSTESRDIFCYRDHRRVAERAAGFGRKVYVIQKGVEDPVLVDGRKTTLRVIALAARGAVWVYGEAMFKTQLEPYRGDATDAAVQFDHSRAERRSSDEFPLFARIFDDIKTRTAHAFEAVAGQFSIHPDRNRFQVFGLDFVISESRGPLLIEVNDWPDISSSAQLPGSDRIRALRERLLSDTLALVLEGRPGRFEAVLAPFAAACSTTPG